MRILMEVEVQMSNWKYIASDDILLDIFYFIFGYGSQPMCEILQVMNTSETEMYSLEVGPRVDIAFIAICASALDLLHARSRLSPLDNFFHWISCLQNQDSEENLEMETNLPSHVI